MGLSGHLPPLLRDRKDRLSKFRGAWQLSLGKISHVAHSTLVDETFQVKAWSYPSGPAPSPVGVAARYVDRRHPAYRRARL